MAKLAQLLSNFGLTAGLCILLFSCQQAAPETKAIPAIFIPTEHPDWQQREGRLWFRNKLFSGWQYRLGVTGDTAFVGAFSQGKAEGFHRHWYVNRRQKEIRHFQNGWHEGQQQGWYESGKPAFIYSFQHDVYEGSLKEWYPNGQPARDGNYHAGQENGLQRQWFADGSLKANYVARNGRNYGFTGVKNCINVWDSITVSP